ncbi:MAG: hypothetical protein KF851_03115 [Pirellulaceae bacterium]|nr:hypothetical protein [Pirellulaceae bacterium]
MTYDQSGKVEFRTDANGIVVPMAYDPQALLNSSPEAIMVPENVWSSEFCAPKIPAKPNRTCLMKCMTLNEISQWQSEHCVTPEPYGNPRLPRHYLQFRVPNAPLSNAEFLRQYFRIVNAEKLVHITDWPLYRPSEMLVMNSLRGLAIESRFLIDAPGHLFAPDEIEFAVALYGKACRFQWNAYLYLPNDRATLYNWEGELFDFWTNDASIFEALNELVCEFELSLNQP